MIEHFSRNCKSFSSSEQADEESFSWIYNAHASYNNNATMESAQQLQVTHTDVTSLLIE